MTELLWPRVSIRHPWPDQRFAVGIHLNLLPGLSNEPGPPRGSDTSAAQGDHQCYRRQSADIRRYAEEALKQAARGPGGTEAVSPWTAFDFLCRVAAGGESPGTHVHSLGLWPIRDGAESDHDEALGNARRFVDTLLGPATAALAPAARIDALRLDAESRRQKSSLERFVHRVDAKPLRVALDELAQEHQSLWVGSLRTEGPAQEITDIVLTPWRVPVDALVLIRHCPTQSRLGRASRLHTGSLTEYHSSSREGSSYPPRGEYVRPKLTCVPEHTAT